MQNSPALGGSVLTDNLTHSSGWSWGHAVLGPVMDLDCLHWEKSILPIHSWIHFVQKKPQYIFFQKRQCTSLGKQRLIWIMWMQLAGNGNQMLKWYWWRIQRQYLIGRFGWCLKLKEKMYYSVGYIHRMPFRKFVRL